MLIRLVNPKTRNPGARHQYVRIEEGPAHDYLRKFVTLLLPQQAIWSGSPGTYRKRPDSVLKALKISVGTFLPSSFRPGGATYFFQEWEENLPRLQWRGRWQSTSMLERYVQELQAFDSWQRLSVDAQHLVTRLEDLGLLLVTDFCFADFYL